MDVSKFRTNTQLEAEGVWLDIGDGVALRVARTGNRRHSELWTKLTSDPKIKRMESLGTVPEAEYERLIIEATVEAILLDWRGFTEDGKPLPFSKEKARELLQLRDFRALVLRLAGEAANFRAETVEAVADELKKN